MRYIVADVYTDSYFELIIDLILRDTYLLADKYIIRLVYAFNATIRQTASAEYVTKMLEEDKTYKIVYDLKQNFAQSLKFVRNICMDACKGLQLKNCENCIRLDSDHDDLKEANSSYHYYKVYQLALRGKGRIDNGIFREMVPHFELAKLTADYLVMAQDQQTGGWAINVTRKFDFLSRLYVKSGWYSAMAQGHAISLMCRLYSRTHEAKYLNAAEKALQVFENAVKENGVRADFVLNTRNTSLIWFEEYPTQPEHLFVLNGFIYSVFGLTDFLTSDCSRVSFTRVKGLVLSALTSLKTLLNMFDLGTRTLYDLRHVFNPKLNPNVARWDYHTLHVSQLFHLSRVVEELRSAEVIVVRFTPDEMELLDECGRVLEIIAHRWLGYVKGIWLQNSQIKYFES